MEPGARKAARDAELRPLMEDFGGMGAGQLPLASPKLALHRALQYAVEFWPYVMNVLEDGHLELSNNVAEQAQRIFVVGRKNWLFSDAPRGARASAAIYSVTTTAKANGLNPRLYVEWLLTEMPNAGELTDEVVDSFLPWSDRVPESCKLDPAAMETSRTFPSVCRNGPGRFLLRGHFDAYALMPPPLVAGGVDDPGGCVACDKADNDADDACLEPE
ncbi:IS66 family transposase [Bifidobacterium longum]|uniref:Uncharacterized protein n=1 Tax=Bifidobacterium longum subsp. longum TaxID=1679 RepID=A0A4R0SV48_BIFLL|nr:transposase [Bifidobacterium longum]TCD86192.1 hypothetical protein MCC10009_0714 [Bifidobacterium longum subsp. longum]TCE20285.1 hypothetical protein MCC10030_0701 [Bifidobacterium longum subsp. longum]